MLEFKNAIYVRIILGIMLLSVFLLVAMLVITIPWLVVNVLILKNIGINIHLSDKENVIAGIATIFLFLFLYKFVLWIFTGSPPFLSFLSRILSVCGIALAVYLFNNEVNNSIIKNFNGELYGFVSQWLKDPLLIIFCSFCLGLVSELIAGIHKDKKYQITCSRIEK